MPDTITSPVLLPSPAAPEQSDQGTLFDLAEVEGFGSLTRRERLFAEGMVIGLSQRAAAKAAGVKGDDNAVDVIACRLAKNPKVKRFLGQCWNRSGASIDETIRQAVRVQARAWHDYENATNREARAAAHKEWREASTLLASIHGKLSLRVDGKIAHAHVNVVTPEARAHLLELQQGFVVPPSALPALAQLRRDVLTDQRDGVLPLPGKQSQPATSAA